MAANTCESGTRWPAWLAPLMLGGALLQRIGANRQALLIVIGGVAILGVLPFVFRLLAGVPHVTRRRMRWMSWLLLLDTTFSLANPRAGVLGTEAVVSALAYLVLWFWPHRQPAPPTSTAD